MKKSLDEKIYLVNVLSTDDFKLDKIGAYGLKMFKKKGVRHFYCLHFFMYGEWALASFNFK